jgi:hypothetical protein
LPPLVDSRREHMDREGAIAPHLLETRSTARITTLSLMMRQDWREDYLYPPFRVAFR